MKTQKVTYQTSKGLIFNTIINAQTPNGAVEIMAKEYDFNQITILKIRPSVKQKYSRVINYQVK